MDKLFHPTLYWVCDYLSMLGYKLIYVCKRDPSLVVSHGDVSHIVDAYCMIRNRASDDIDGFIMASPVIYIIIT